MILDTIIESRKRRLYELKKQRPLGTIKQEAQDFAAAHDTKDFAAAIACSGISIIAEVKKASPSKGIIKEDFNPVETAVSYEKAGANAISVLTEEDFFKGSGEYLKAIRAAVSLPLLRKDFIVDEWQIYEARLLGADAILLITGVLARDALKRFIAIADELSMQCLVEAHTEEQIKSALGAGAEIIGINNRNLDNFTVDLGTSQRIAKLLPDVILFVAESGIRSRADVKCMENVGADAVLVGETLMRAPSIEREIKILRGVL